MTTLYFITFIRWGCAAARTKTTASPSPGAFRKAGRVGRARWQRPRLYGDLYRPAVRERFPRLRHHRLPSGRPASRHQRGVQGVCGRLPCAGPEGHRGRRVQPCGPRFLRVPGPEGNTARTPATSDWFCDVNFWGNNEYNDGFSYGNWGGFNLLVKLNQRNPEVQNYHFDTIRFWVDEFDIDGIRLDAADVLDFDFMKGLRRVANEVKPEFWLMGEVIHGDYSRWANPEMLHSVTNYELHKGLWSGHNDHNYFEIAHTMRRLQGLCHDTRLYNFSDNHDVERLPNKLRNRDHIRHIALLVYTLWGIPSIYYGSEFGIEGKKEWGSDWPLRPCLELADYTDAEKTNPVTSIYAALGRLKAECPELSWGEFKELTLTTPELRLRPGAGRQGCRGGVQ